MTDSLPSGVHLHSDDFWHYIRQGRIAPYLPQAHQQNQTVIDALAQHVLDSSRLSPPATADAVLRGLAEGTYCLVPDSSGRT